MFLICWHPRGVVNLNVNFSTLFNRSKYVTRFRQLVSSTCLSCGYTMALYGVVMAALDSSENERGTTTASRVFWGNHRVSYAVKSWD